MESLRFGKAVPDTVHVEREHELDAAAGKQGCEKSVHRAMVVVK